MENLLKSAQSGMTRKGKTFLINHLKGKVLTRDEAIKAKCYDCDGMGESGECEITTCPLFPYSPYGKENKK